MEGKSDSSDSDPESLTQVTVGSSRTCIKRNADQGKGIVRKRSKLSPGSFVDSSVDEPPTQLSKRSPPFSPQKVHGECGENLQNPLIPVSNIKFTGSDHQIFPEESGRSSPKPFSTTSNILPNFPENPQQYESESGSLPSNYEMLLSSHPQSISENLSEKYSIIEEPMVIDTNASDPLDDLISFRNLKQSLQVIPNTDNLQQDQPNSSSNMDPSRSKRNFIPSYIFRNLLYAPSAKEVEEFAYERTIFQPNFPTDVLSEDKYIFKDIKNVFESEGKLKVSTGQTETWSVYQTVDEDASQNLSDQGNQNCQDLDKFLERWEVTKRHVLMTIEEPNDSLLTSSTSKSKKRKESPNTLVPFSGQAKKRLGIAESSETIASSFESSSSEEQHGSNQNVRSSFENETEIIVRTIALDMSDANTSSKLEKFIKNTKIKLLEDDEVPPFVEKFTSLDSESFPDRTSGSSLTNDSFEILQVDTKNIINLLKNRFCVGENVSSSTNDSDKIKELTSEDGDHSVVDGDDEMIS